MSVQDKDERAAFEKWAAADSYHFDLTLAADGTYVKVSTFFAYLGWDASRRAAFGRAIEGVDDGFVALVEDAVGHGNGAWDMIDPAKICRAVLKVARERNGV